MSISLKWKNIIVFFVEMSTMQTFHHTTHNTQNTHTPCPGRTPHTRLPHLAHTVHTPLTQVNTHHRQNTTPTTITTQYTHQQQHHHPHHHHNRFSQVARTGELYRRTPVVATGDHAGGDAGAARRRRERQLRTWAKHERLSVAMALAVAVHHSAGPSTKKVMERRERQEEAEHETHKALWGPKTPPSGQRPGLLTEPAPQWRLEAAARVSVVVPTLAIPSLAGAGGEE